MKTELSLEKIFEFFLYGKEKSFEQAGRIYQPAYDEFVYQKSDKHFSNLIGISETDYDLTYTRVILKSMFE